MENNIFIDLLDRLDVPHTDRFSTAQYEAMPFHTLFGLSKLLESYHVDTEAVMIGDKSELDALPVPFIASMDAGLVIVTNHNAKQVSYLTQGVEESIPLDEFVKAWSGMAMMAFPAPNASEPSYTSHRFSEIVARLRDVGLWVGLFLLVAYGFVANGLYRSWSTILLTVFNLAGLYITLLLVRKTLNIKSKAADRVCAVLQAGGCDHVLETSASKLFGVFSWSEVGFGYFGVSLAVLLMFPQYTGYLALCNACCLPYTIWSVTYQKFVAKAWCTLCLTTQLLLWLLFGCYLGGGWYADIFPLRLPLLVILVAYVTVVFVLSRVLPNFENKKEQ